MALKGRVAPDTRTLLVVALVCAMMAVAATPALADHIEDPADEIFFYRDDGLFRYYNISPAASIGSPILQGDGYTSNWSSITGVDLDGDGQDEIFFYRDDGLFRYYDIESDGTIGAPILQGDGYTKNWTAVTAVDMDGDDQDEMLFYRGDGLFRYYDINSNGTLGSPILAGDSYTPGWTSITAVNLDGHNQDELFFYRDDGLFRYYYITGSGRIGTPVLQGDYYTTGWSSITGIDLDGAGSEQMLFYRDDGLFRYYNTDSSGINGPPILAGNDYTSGWSSITSIQLDAPVEHVSDCSTVSITGIHYDAAGNDNLNPNGEWVVFRNDGAEPADFSGCRLHDSGAVQTYSFPSGFRLGPGRFLTLYTGSGTNTSSALYWGSGAAIWNNDGDVATLRGPNGAVVDLFSY